MSDEAEPATPTGKCTACGWSLYDNEPCDACAGAAPCLLPVVTERAREVDEILSRVTGAIWRGGK
jgi:hypothetical protein